MSTLKNTTFPQRGETISNLSALLPAKVLFYFGIQHGIIAVIVLEDDAMFEEGDTGTDVEGVGQVVGRHDDSGFLFLAVGLQQVLHRQLGGGVEEIERFIKYQQFGIVQHGTDDAHLLLVTHGEVAYQRLLPQYLTIHETIELKKTVVHDGI